MVIGELPFISGLPIGYPIRESLAAPRGFSIRTGRPGELDQWMRDGELAAGPLSVVEYLTHRERYTVASALSISSWGRLGSATLFSTKPFARLCDTTIAIPPHGATANVLIRWMLQRLFGVDAYYVETPGNLDTLLTSYPAVLLIGDEGFLANRHAPDNLYQLDLGEAWWQMMHTPFVHTVWACQRSLHLEQQDNLLQMFAEAKSLMPAYRAPIINHAASILKVDASAIEAYFSLLNYDFGAAHQASLDLMAQALADGLSKVVP
jgi:chorismate dehydratase